MGSPHRGQSSPALAMRAARTSGGHGAVAVLKIKCRHIKSPVMYCAKATAAKNAAWARAAKNAAWAKAVQKRARGRVMNSLPEPRIAPAVFVELSIMALFSGVVTLNVRGGLKGFTPVIFSRGNRNPQTAKAFDIWSVVFNAGSRAPADGDGKTAIRRVLGPLRFKSPVLAVIATAAFVRQGVVHGGSPFPENLSESSPAIPQLAAFTERPGGAWLGIQGRFGLAATPARPVPCCSALPIGRRGWAWVGGARLLS